jgi:hypothetical protein
MEYLYWIKWAKGSHDQQVLPVWMKGCCTTCKRNLACVQGEFQPWRVSQKTVVQILHEWPQYPYHLQWVQGFASDDYLGWAVFSHIFLLTFYLLIKQGLHKTVLPVSIIHVWEDENPHAIVHLMHQRRFSIDMWAGIMGDWLIRPYVLSLVDAQEWHTIILC